MVMSPQADGGGTAQPPGGGSWPTELGDRVIHGTASDPAVSSPGPAPHSPSALGRGACAPVTKRVRGDGQRAQHGGSWVPCLAHGDSWPLTSSVEPRLRGRGRPPPHPSPSDVLQQPGSFRGS